MPEGSADKPSPGSVKDDVATGMGNIENRREKEAQQEEAGGGGGARAAADASATTDAYDDDEDANCPICAFVGAGPCADTHRAWSSCRKQHRDDFVDACKPKFVEFFRCMTATEGSRAYHAPLLRAFGAPGMAGEGEGGAEGEEGGAREEEGRTEGEKTAEEGAGGGGREREKGAAAAASDEEGRTT